VPRGNAAHGAVLSCAFAIRLLTDDDGQDLVEYALLSGIVGIGSVLLLPTIATAMHDAYVSWHTAAHTVWEPCPPSPAACP
jgi:Flp pilus assembly pilin Flp